MDTVKTGTGFTIQRLTRDATPAHLLPETLGATQQNFTINVTFVFTGLTGNSKVVNGQTWYEAAGTCTFDNTSITIGYGNTGKIKFKMDSNGSTNGWKLSQFIPKSNNPAGGPVATDAGADGNIDVDDSNTVAGTYSYGVYLVNPNSNYYFSYDPVIVQDGGGEG